MDSFKDKKEKCMKQFASIYEFTGDMNDKVLISGKLYYIFNKHFDNDEYVKSLFPNLNNDECKKICVWFELVGIDFVYYFNGMQRTYNGFLYGYKEILSEDVLAEYIPSREVSPGGITSGATSECNISSPFKCIQLKSVPSDGVPEIVKKFNSLYMYTGDENDSVTIHHIMNNLNIPKIQGEDVCLTMYHWLNDLNIDDDSPSFGTKGIICGGITFTCPTLKKYTKVNKNLLRRVHL